MTRVLTALIAMLIAVGLVFAALPSLDMTVTHAFYDRFGFVGSNPTARWGREIFRIGPFVLLGALAGLYLARRLGYPLPGAPDGRSLFFLVATIAIGSGLIVNLGMKDHLHRPRPVHVTDFGGQESFLPWYRFDGACAKNCSFPSGEASSGFWMVAPALLVPPPLQAPAIAAALAFGVGASALRMAFGGHFLSDVLVGGLISLIVVFALHRALWPRGRPYPRREHKMGPSASWRQARRPWTSANWARAALARARAPKLQPLIRSPKFFQFSPSNWASCMVRIG